MVEFFLSLLLLFSPEIASKVAPKPTYARPAPVERAAEAPPITTPGAEVPGVAPTR